MSTSAEIAIYIIRTLGSLYLMLVILRLLFQMVRADFYNPISQFVAKATNPLLMPLRKVIPGFFGVDLAALVLALAVQWLLIQLVLVIAGLGFLNPLYTIAWSAIGLLSVVLSIYFWCLIISIIASWVAPFSQHPALILVRQLVAPVMAPFQKLIPPLGGIDITPIFAFMVLHILNRYLVPALGQSVGMPGGLVIGM
ncbi:MULTISPECIES: YggT family protein [unclassified Marinimicrobium]|jgi:YggT family protein|uniref:YggT family protein n=1 Tax=unclassified Marinimicrobium TaxID=2632100 RepID=UPI00257CABBF|nr:MULTISPECIES: YggT family protein [unclassified Marinimicrobium]|tara:strand:- start:162 stop:752 length:591 start_codon:yes stop_codon:yes gene_type:complete